MRIFLDELSDANAVAVAAAMRDVAMTGVSVARQLCDDILEVRADGDRQAYRLLVAPEGRHGQILLALEGFSKRTQKAPPAKIESDEIRPGSSCAFAMTPTEPGRIRTSPRLVDEALARRQLLRDLAAEREAEGLTRTMVAARMGTSESAVARLEKGEADAKMSTVGRYAAAFGKRVEWRIVDQAGGRRRAG